MHNKSTHLLLNIGHALDHMFLLIFATAVTTIAKDFGVERWEDLMPYSVAAFFFFGLGSMPAGRLGDAMRSRVSGMRLAVSLGASSLAVWLIGPIVKAAGFTTLIWVMAATSCITFAVVSLLPSAKKKASK